MAVTRSGARISARGRVLDLRSDLACGRRVARLAPIRRTRTLRQQPQLAGLDPQGKIFGINPALGKAAGDEPQTGLRRAHEHVAQFLALAEAPDRADPARNLATKELAHQVLLPLIAGRQYDQIGREQFAISHPCTFGVESRDIRKLCQPHLAVDDQIGATDVEIIAAAARQVLELPAGAAFAEVELESALRQSVEQRLIECLACSVSMTWLVLASDNGTDIVMRSQSSSGGPSS